MRYNNLNRITSEAIIYMICIEDDTEGLGVRSGSYCNNLRLLII
jgi:hypothetical protein